MRALITGMGAHCAMGSSLYELWRNLSEGFCGIVPITRFDVTPFECSWGGMVPGGDNFESEEERLLSYALNAATEALKDAAITDTRSVSLVLGTSNGIMGKKIYDISYRLADELNIGAPVISVSTACTSSAHAIGFAGSLLQKGESSIVIAGGVDTLTRDVFAGFHSLGLLSKNPCAPFSTPLGTTLGEGAAFLVLETEENAKRRGLRPKAVFMGFGISADSFHDTRPDPGGSGIARAILSALKDSNLEPGDIDYINAHGTGTAANDSAEWRGIQSALSHYSVNIPVSSSKSFLGHAQGAASALEAVTAITAMLHNKIPPTMNYSVPRMFSPGDPVAASKPRDFRTRYVMSTNSAFGGVNTALVFGKNDLEFKPATTIRRSVSVIGYAINTDKDFINRYIPYDDLRSIDLSARLLTGVVAKILTAAGIQFRSKDCENIGLFAGQDHLSGESMDALDNSIRERGIRHLSAAAFTRLVINYPAGVCCRLFGLKGPVAAVAARPDNGLTALCLAADYLAGRNDTDMLIVAAVTDNEESENIHAGAAGLLLRAGDEQSPVRLRKWSMSGKNNFDMGMDATTNNEGIILNLSSTTASRGLCSIIDTIENPGDTNRKIFNIKSGNDPRYMEIEIILERND